MKSHDTVLVMLGVGFVAVCVAMAALHPDRKWPADEKVVTLLTPAPPTYTKIFNEAVERFEAKFADEGLRVRYISVPYSHYYRKVNFMEVARLQADVIYMDQSEFPKLVPKGLLEDLNSWIEADPEFSTEPYYDIAMKQVAFFGQQVGMPLLFSPVLVFYNRTAFEEGGVPLPSEEWTYDEFLDAAKTLARDDDGDGVTDFFGVVGVTGTARASPWVWREGGRIFSEDLSRCLIDSPEAIRGLTFLAELVQKHKVAPTPADRQGQVDREMFKTGRAAMILDSRFSRDTYKEITDFEWEIAAVPRCPRTGLNTTAMIVDSISLAAHGKNKELGWKLIKFLVSEEMMQVYADVGTGFPSMKSVAENRAIDRTLRGDGLFLQVPEDSRYLFFPTKAPKEVSGALERLEAIWSGRAAPEAVAKEIVRRIHRGLERAEARERRMLGRRKERESR